MPEIRTAAIATAVIATAGGSVPRAPQTRSVEPQRSARTVPVPRAAAMTPTARQASGAPHPSASLGTASRGRPARPASTARAGPACPLQDAGPLAPVRPVRNAGRGYARRRPGAGRQRTVHRIVSATRACAATPRLNPGAGLRLPARKDRFARAAPATRRRRAAPATRIVPRASSALQACATSRPPVARPMRTARAARSARRPRASRREVRARRVPAARVRCA